MALASEARMRELPCQRLGRPRPLLGWYMCGTCCTSPPALLCRPALHAALGTTSSCRCAADRTRQQARAHPQRPQPPHVTGPWIP